VNESTGDWRLQSFGDRANEAIAAVRHLASRGGIDPTRIGLVGHSRMNDTEVDRRSRSALPVDGHFGLRINHGLELHVNSVGVR
jgi:hypothetical protein